LAIRYVFVLTILGLMLLGSFMQPASAQVQVSVGYLDFVHGQPPDPANFFTCGTFQPIFVGLNGCNPANQPLLDTGLIQVVNIANRQDAAVTIEQVTVVTEGNCAAKIFKIWGGPVDVPAQGFGTNVAVFLQTTDSANFDSSNCGLALDPVVILQVKIGLTQVSTQLTCVDGGRVLLGQNDAGEQGKNESTPFERIPCLQF
jgi:hypothetical protein